MLADRADRVETAQAGLRELPGKGKGELGVLGLSYRSEEFYRLEGLRIPEPRRLETLDALQWALGFGELVYLATCNRVEFIYSAERPLQSAEDPRLRQLLELLELPGDRATSFHVHTGGAALRYLFEVASSLDSMVVGEAQILGQLKRAYQQARAELRAGPVLAGAVEQAFHAAKEVRASTGLSRRKLSLVSLVAEEVREHLCGLEQPAIALLGAGEMIAKVACLVAPCEEWAPGRLLFVNRTLERAETLASLYGGEAMSLESFLAMPPRVDLLATATSAGTSLLGRAEVTAMLGEGAAGKLLIVDLAVPGDVARDAAEIDGVRLVGIEGLRERAEQNRQARQAEVVRATPLLERAVERALEASSERALGELACQMMGTLDGHLPAGPESLDAQAGYWRRLLLERAHKVLMSGIRQRAVRCACAAADRTEVPTGAAVEAASPEPFLASLASPVSLDRRAFRTLSPAAQAELERWHREQALRLSCSITGLLGRFDPSCRCPE